MVDLNVEIRRETGAVDVVHERAAGMGISKRDAKAAVRVPWKRAGTCTTSVTTWRATVSQILELIEFFTVTMGTAFLGAFQR